jgi:hypothetical protein
MALSNEKFFESNFLLYFSIVSRILLTKFLKALALEESGYLSTNKGGNYFQKISHWIKP